MSGALTEWIIKKLSQWLLYQEPARRAYLCDFDKICQKIKPADVLVFDGRSRVSKIIKHVTQSPWSHAALYIGRLQDIKDLQLQAHINRNHDINPEQQFLIESEIGTGTVISPIEKYREDHIRILRPEWLTPQDAESVIHCALGRLGRQYNVRQLLDLARFILPWGFFPRRWRSSLFQHHALQPTKDVCSSMIAEAFQSVDYPILPLIREDDKKQLELIRRNTRLFTPSDFDYSPFFSIIKYPIFPTGVKGWYATLPWVDAQISDV
jgi:hypothetical protein